MRRILMSGRVGWYVCAALAVALCATSCSKAKHNTSQSRPASSSPTSSAPAAATATRWWSNSAVTVGSQIDPSNPGAAAARLRPSQTDYCGMLGQTLKSGKSLIAGVQAADPGLRLGVQAFVPEIEKVAPTGVTGQWHVLGPTVLALAKSATAPSSGSSAVTAQALATVSAIATDAKTRCGLDLTPLIVGVGG